jgi:hypothetical protein
MKLSGIEPACSAVPQPSEPPCAPEAQVPNESKLYGAFQNVWTSVERHKSLAPTGNQTRFLDLPSLRLVTILNTLSQLLYIFRVRWIQLIHLKKRDWPEQLILDLKIIQNLTLKMWTESYSPDRLQSEGLFWIQEWRFGFYKIPGIFFFSGFVTL